MSRAAPAQEQGLHSGQVTGLPQHWLGGPGGRAGALSRPGLLFCLQDLAPLQILRVLPTLQAGSAAPGLAPGSLTASPSAGGPADPALRLWFASGHGTQTSGAVEALPGTADPEMDSGVPAPGPSAAEEADCSPLPGPLCLCGTPTARGQAGAQSIGHHGPRLPEPQPAGRGRGRSTDSVLWLVGRWSAGVPGVSGSHPDGGGPGRTFWTEGAA